MLFELENVDYRYSDGNAAVEGISAAIDSGERVAILGANGSGKSTLLRLMNGLLFPTSGSFKFRGRLVSESALRDAEMGRDFRQSVGFVFQNADAQLFNATVFDEVAFGPRQMGMTNSHLTARVKEVLEFLGIEHLHDRPPFRLSGGEKRKVAIASVLSMNPEVLMLDEPFLGLDPRSQTWLVRTLRQLQAAGKTTIIATHTLDLVPRIADTAIVLGENHSVLFTGRVQEVLTDPAILAEANLIEEELEYVR